MNALLHLAPWELASAQDDVLAGEASATHRLHLEGETHPVIVRLAPDVRGQFLQFLRRQDDEREGNWVVKDNYRLEAKRFKESYSPQLSTVRRAISNGIGRVFHFENLDARFGNERFKGIWRVWLGMDGYGSWTNLELPAPTFEPSRWGGGQEFVFRVGQLPKDWQKQSASEWRNTLGEELQNSESGLRFALDFACASRAQQENARLRLERGTMQQLREVLTWLVQTHEPLWGNVEAWLWEVSSSGGGDFSYSGGGNGEDEIWEFVNRPPILKKWGLFVIEKMGVTMDEAKQERHPCLQEKFCHFSDALFDLRIGAPTQHERMEAFLGLRDWVEEFAPDDGKWLLPS